MESPVPHRRHPETSPERREQAQNTGYKPMGQSADRRCTARRKAPRNPNPKILQGRRSPAAIRTDRPRKTDQMTTSRSPILYKFRKAREGGIPNQSATSHLFLSWLPRYGKTTQPRPRISRNHEKQPFRALGWIENTKNYSAEPSDEQKTRKTNFPRPRMDRKREIPRFRALG